MNSTKIFGRVVNGTIILLILVTIGLVGFYLFNRSQEARNQLNQPSPGSSQQITDNESEQKVFNALENKIVGTLSKKNGWKNSDYTVTISHIDALFMAGTIIPNNSNVPAGVFLANNTQDGNYPIVFDSTTSNPCALLVKNVLYPQVVTDMCETSNENQPAPSDASDN